MITEIIYYNIETRKASGLGAKSPRPFVFCKSKGLQHKGGEDNEGGRRKKHTGYYHGACSQ